ncbi:peptidase M56 [Rhodanobacter sp. B04]|uniref:M56 family metallopeptidase n=1 Tax=Rhodanobacter sp. B04 TaxID=1945860 RepID=UPI000985405A|nr:M56 family metallopeptidase [Rhodanobacter sp. B04]OOG64004.1 peptidase M56 [Rhodanobacter sp. B04]
MSSIDLAGIDWIGRGWLLILAFTAAVLVVTVLRKLCRYLFGAERAFQLWWLPPLAMLASQLPHTGSASVAALPPLVYMITSVTSMLPAHASSAVAVEWRGFAVLIWCAGVVMAMLLAVLAQWRYRNRLLGATPMAGVPSHPPVLRAARADVGPALVGAWRVRIVVPVDFEQRYDTTERALILAHEAMHARRRDGWWCLLAQATAAVFWFHPLAWWALGALRHDQELACDAAVLRHHGEQRRNYANAMLKTQTALFALPVGCPWSPRHPLTERIAMLKSPLPGRLRRSVGMIASLTLASVVAGAVYAASAVAGQPSGMPATSATDAHEYQLNMKVELTTDDAHRSHAERATLALCVVPGKGAAVSTQGWRVDATTLPEGDNRVRIDLAVTGTDSKKLADTQLHGALGESLHADGMGKDGKHRYAIDVTPLAGCPARTQAADTGARLKLLSQSVKNEPVRAVAKTVAAKAGLVLVNPELLDERPVTLNFEQITAERAMQLLADIDGMKAVFEGSRVHFEPK